MKKKILFVVQRYGLEVNGGAELHCRQLAERLKDEYDVSVLTTCAIDYVTWKNEYKEGIEHINGVKVIRKKVDFERNQKKFNKISAKLNNEKDNINLGIEWQEAQGPHSSELIKYLEDHKDDYDVIIFLTYLYYTTYFGLKVAPEKSILIPTAHDEPPIYYSIFNETFNLPKAILYSTATERDFVNKRFKNDYIESDIVGLGVDINENAQDINLEKTFGIKDDYVVYIGRIDESKGCKEMFEYFLEYKKTYGSNLKLVLAGKSAMEIPGNKDIVTLGATAASEFLTDEDKKNIDMIIIGTESGIDQSKSASIFIHNLLGLSPFTRAIEVKEACYGGTAAIAIAKNHVASNPESSVLVITSDLAKYGIGATGESTQGAGSCAMLIKKERETFLRSSSKRGINLGGRIKPVLKCNSQY